MFSLWIMLGQPAKTRLFLALCLSAAAGAASVMLLGLSGWFLTAAALAGMAGGGYIFNHLYPSAGVRASAFARVLTRYAEQLVGHDATLAISAALRPKIFAAAAQSRRGFTPLAASELSALIDDVDAAEAGFLKVISPLMAVLASMCVALGFSFSADVWGGTLVLASGFVVIFALPKYIVHSTRERSRQLDALAETARVDTARMIENAVELDTFQALERTSKQTQSTLHQWIDRARSEDLTYKRVSVITSAVGAMSAMFLIWRAIQPEQDLAMGVAAALAVIAAFDAAASMVSILTAANHSEQAASRLTSRLVNSEASWNPPLDTALHLKQVFPILAQDLSFRPADDAPAIGPIDFEIVEGQIVQLVGPSGSGKTTLAETIMRLQPVLSGTLSFNSVDSSRLRLAEVLQRISYAPQLPTFIPGSLVDQFRLANPTISNEQIESALQTACASGFVGQSEHGLESDFSENSFPFSGGELRRIGIARAMITDPGLLILDEPLAGLDDQTALQLASSLKNWAQEGRRSLLIIGHEPNAMFGDDVIELKRRS